MLITLHMFSLSVVCTLNTQLKLLPFKRYTVLRQTVNGNFNLTPTVAIGLITRTKHSINFDLGQSFFNYSRQVYWPTIHMYFCLL